MAKFDRIDYQLDKLMMLVSQTAAREKNAHDLEYLDWLSSKLEAIQVESHQKLQSLEEDD